MTSRYLFAEQIFHDLDELKDATEHADMPENQSKPLKNRIEVAKHQIETGIDKIQKGKELQAIKRFKKSLNFVNRYLKLLAQKVKKGKISPLLSF